MADRREIVVDFEAAPIAKQFIEEFWWEAQYLQGPFGSSKTMAGVTKLIVHGEMMAARPLPPEVAKFFGRPKGLPSKYVVIRRYWEELKKTTLQTFLQWFGSRGTWVGDSKTFVMKKGKGITSEIVWMGLDSQGDEDKLKSLDVTGFLIDEASEVSDGVFLTAQGRKRRFPTFPDKEKYGKLLKDAPGLCVSNPPDDEHWLVREFERTERTTYRQYTQPSGLAPNAENRRHLPANYYENLLDLYKSRPDLQTRYVHGQRAVLVKGGPVYQHQFDRDATVTTQKPVWGGAKILRGWDASGNVPAAVVSWLNPAGRWDVVKEFVSDRVGMGEFGGRVVEWCRTEFPGAYYVDVGDPATFQEYTSDTGQGFTSNALILERECGVKMIRGVQGFAIRRDALGDRLVRRGAMQVYGPGCPRFVSGLAGGYAYPELSEGRGYGKEPIKNQYSHVVEAAQYLATYLMGMATDEIVVPMPHIFRPPMGNEAWMG